jgi:hypothetical protein
MKHDVVARLENAKLKPNLLQLVSYELHAHPATFGSDRCAGNTGSDERSQELTLMLALVSMHVDVASVGQMQLATLRALVVGVYGTVAVLQTAQHLETTGDCQSSPGEILREPRRRTAPRWARNSACPADRYATRQSKPPAHGTHTCIHMHTRTHKHSHKHTDTTNTLTQRLALAATARGVAPKRRTLSNSWT